MGVSHRRSAARSTRASPPRRGSTRGSTRSMPSTRPAPPTSPARRHEGWILAKDRFDDGGVSGGTLERPALQRLLAEIEAGRISMVVVYKIDRLTRSLADFARLVERLRGGGLLLRLGHPVLQHRHLDGAADAERAPVLCAVRTRGDRRAHPRQDRRLEEEGALDGRRAAARLRSAPRSEGPGTRPQPGRGRDGPHSLRALRSGRQPRDRRARGGGTRAAVEAASVPVGARAGRQSAVARPDPQDPHQPGLHRQDPAQGSRLARAAPGDHRGGPLGPRPGSSCRPPPAVPADDLAQ